MKLEAGEMAFKSQRPSLAFVLVQVPITSYLHC